MTDNEHDLLARLDERSKSMQHQLQDISEKLEMKYVTKDQFEPIKRIVYGMVGVVLVTFMGALGTLIIK